MENEIDMWFEEHCFVPKQQIPTDSDNEPEVVTIEQVIQFLALRKFHRRNYNYPTYAAIMKEAENLGVGSSRLLNKEQLVLLLNKWTVPPNIQHELQLAFQVFDTENRGFLELEELDMIVSMYGERFTPPEVRELLRDANLRGDGNIDYHQFVRSMFRIAPELNDIQVEYLYTDGDQDPSVEPEPEPEPVEPEPPPPEPEPPAPPPPEPTGGKKGAKKKK